MISNPYLVRQTDPTENRHFREDGHQLACEASGSSPPRRHQPNRPIVWANR